MVKTEQELEKASEEIYNWLRHEKYTIPESAKILLKVAKYLKISQDKAIERRKRNGN